MNAKKPENVRFSGLLDQGISGIRADYKKKGVTKTIGSIEQDLSAALGYVTNPVNYWRRGYPPEHAREVVGLARELVKRGKLDRRWFVDFLKAAQYPAQDIELRAIELFPSIPSTQNDQENGGSEGKGNLPLYPSMFIGRDRDVDLIVDMLTKPIVQKGVLKRQLIIRGWPGVGKSTVATVVGYDQRINSYFADGILWISLGQQPDILELLAKWLRLLGHNPDKLKTVDERSEKLGAILRDNRILIIIDDVWEAQHAHHFLVGGAHSATLITTRLQDVAYELQSGEDIYLLDVLSDTSALDLLSAVYPRVVKEYPDKSMDLVKDLEGLPLAIQVAGKLLRTEENHGYSILTLLVELKNEGTKILQASVPFALREIAEGTSQTVAALLSKSTDRLDAVTKERFAYLGAFAPKPAEVDTAILAAAWQVKDPRPTIEILLDRGLIERTQPNWYQMHALLVLLAKSLQAEPS